MHSVAFVSLFFLQKHLLMIDLVTFVKSNLSDSEVMQIVAYSNLQTCTRSGEVFFETSLQAKNKDNVYIKIETNNNLKIECSLHKLYEKETTGRYTNYGLFTMQQAQEIAEKLLNEKGISPNNLRVYNYEVGLNLYMQKDCSEYINQIESIGMQGDEKELYVNPKYKDERVKTTVFHRHIRKHFKVYDKCFEAKDKRRKDIPDKNILRIETTCKRVEKMSFDKFFSSENLSKVRITFFNDWRTLHFKKEIEVPKGTRVGKIELCKMILQFGTETALSQAREKHRIGVLTDKQFRVIREFITHGWKDIKGNVQIVKSIENKEFITVLDERNIVLKSLPK